VVTSLRYQVKKQRQEASRRKEKEKQNGTKRGGSFWSALSQS